MPDWIALSLCSALFLGIYDCLKKKAVDGNSSITTLFFATSSGGCVCLCLLFWRAFHSPSFSHYVVEFPDLTSTDLILIFAKSALVSCSWIFAYLSLKHLPLSVVAPIRSSGPLWTLILAWVTFAEFPNSSQSLAFILTLGSFLWFSILGKKDGIKALREPWVLCILLGTWLGAISSVYDKWLIQSHGLHPIAVLLYFFVGMIFFQGGILLTIRSLKIEKTTFQWRWSIPFVGLTLIIADAFYFYALNNPDALVALVSATRRGSLLVAFAMSLWVIKEPQAKGKTLPILGIFLGISWISYSSS